MIAIVVVLVVVAVVAWALWRRSRKQVPVAVEPARPSRVTDPTPMRGLEGALDQVTDRSGKNMREKIEGGTAIDDLRVPNDTGPILRRALDNVEHAKPDEPANAPPAAESGGG